MSASVNLVLEQFQAVNDRDFPRAMSLYTEDVVLTVDPEAFLEHGTYEGREAVGRWFGNWFATFERDYHFEIDEAREIGDLVLLVASHRGRGRTSGIEVSGQTGYVYTVRNGKVTRVELYPGREAAIAAAEGHRNRTQ